MATQLFKKPTRLVHEYAALESGLRHRIDDAARHAIKMRDGLCKPIMLTSRSGHVYLKEYFGCCLVIGEPTVKHPLRYLNHARTVTHVAHELRLDKHEKAIRTVIRLLDAGEALDEVVARCHFLNALKGIKTLIRMAHSN